MRIIILLLLLVSCSSPHHEKKNDWKIRGGMDPDIIRKELLSNLENFRSCYNKFLDENKSKKKKEVQGVVLFDFTISNNGEVIRAKVNSASSGFDQKIKKCLTQKLLDVRFPKPQASGVIEVKQPFNFYPVTKKKSGDKK